MTQSEIIAKTLVILNEAGGDTQLSLLSEDTLRISDYIEKSIKDGVRMVQAVSPQKGVCPKNGKETSLATDTKNGVASLVVPDGFVSLIGVRLSGWSRVCTEAEDMDSENYLRQCNSYTRSGANHPVCIHGFGDDGIRNLFLYPYKESYTLDMFMYESEYSSTSDIPDDFSLAVCYMTASVVYTIFENKAAADAMRQMAVACLSKK